MTRDQSPLTERGTTPAATPPLAAGEQNTKSRPDLAPGSTCADGVASSPASSAYISINLPWPPAELSPNFRTRSKTLVALRRKQYRAKCSRFAWLQGVNPALRLTVDRIVFHAPDARSRDDDNLIARFKAGRDGLADAMGVDDASFNGVPVTIGQPVKGGAVVVLLAEIPG